MQRERTPEEVRRHEAASSARSAIRNMQRQIASRLVAVSEKVEGLLEHMSEKEVVHFLHAACEMDLTEAAAHVKASRTLKESRQLLMKARAGFPLMKSLATADLETREEALSRIREGATLGARDVSAIRSHLRRQKLSVFEIKDRQASAEARRAALDHMAQGATEIDSQVGEIMIGIDRLYFDRVAPSERKELKQKIQEAASAILPRVEQVYGKTAADLDGLLRSKFRQIDLVHPALSKIADGAFDGSHGFDVRQAPGGSKGIMYLGRCLKGATSVRPLVRWQAEGVAPSRILGMARRPRVVELCAGAGGMALGLERAGYEPVALFEYDGDAAATLLKNRRNWPVIKADIRTVDFKPYSRQRVDLLVGGLPCQPYSVEGMGLGKDDSRDLLPEGARAVEEMQPGAFVFENVTGLLHARHADHLGHFLKRLRKAGYSVQIIRMEAEDYGVPQERSRIMIVGMRKERMATFRMPPRLPEMRTNIADAIEDLMGANGWSGAAAWAEALRAQVVVKNGVEFRGAIASTVVGRKGGSRDKERIRWGRKGIDIRNVADSAPTQEEADAAGDGFLPSLTLRMRARLQAFPDDWEFTGGKDSSARQIGNAVPPPVGMAIGLAVRAALQGLEFDYLGSLGSGAPQEREDRRRASVRRVPSLAPALVEAATMRTEHQEEAGRAGEDHAASANADGACT